MFTCLPELVPWQRRQVSYWFTAGFTGVVPSVSLTPSVLFCDGRGAGGSVNPAVCSDACGLWQSTQVACRLLFNSADSARSCKLFAEGAGCDPTFANSAYTLRSAGCVLVPA